MSKKLKGFGPLLMVLGIMIVLIIILVFATQVYVKTHMTNVKLEVTVAIESDARGSWPVSFLKSETGGMSYMEILGSVRADNYNDFLGERLKVIEDQVKKSAELDKKQKE
ncbi:MAG TPA: hypothetical protein VJB06_00325, partial [archaeon]|nr:hypothetical protein [archaeon]